MKLSPAALTRLWRKEGLQQGVCLLFYFAANLCLTIHNKWVLSRMDFNFPWVLTTIHISISGLGAYLMLRLFRGHGLPSSVGRNGTLRLLLFSALYSLNIAISNISLAHVSLNFHQLMRSATPAFTILLEFLIFRKLHTRWVYAALIPVVAGIGMATVAEFASVSFTALGSALTLLGVLTSCAKTILTNLILVGPLNLHPLEVISHMTLPSAMQCLFYAALTGELAALRQFLFSPPLPLSQDGGGASAAAGFRYEIVGKLALNGCLAMALNWASFTANKKTSPLTMTVAGNMKQALSIVLAILIFNAHISLLNWMGIIVALAGGAWYSYEAYWEQRGHKRSTLLLDKV